MMLWPRYHTVRRILRAIQFSSSNRDSFCFQLSRGWGWGGGEGSLGCLLLSNFKTTATQMTQNNVPIISKNPGITWLTHWRYLTSLSRHTREFINLLQEWHKNLCSTSITLHKHCFQFLLTRTIAPSKIENNAYVNVWRDNKECYGIFFFGRKEMVAWSINDNFMLQNYCSQKCKLYQMSAFIGK